MNFLTNGVLAIGIFLGISICILVEFYFDFFGVSWQPDSGLIGVIVGASIALIGTAITLLASKEEIEKQHALREEGERLRKLQVAYELFESLNEIVATTNAVRNHLKRCFDEAVQHGLQFKVIAVMTTAKASPTPRISNEAKVLLLSLKEIDLYNLIGNVDVLAMNELYGFEAAQLRREEFMKCVDIKKYFLKGVVSFLPGCHEEGPGRAAVLEGEFLEQKSNFDKLEVKLRNCIVGTSDLIHSLGDKGFKFDFNN